MLSKKDIVEFYNEMRNLFEAYLNIASKKISLIESREINLLEMPTHEVKIDIPNFKVSVLLENYEYEPDINKEIDINQLDKVVDIDITIPEINEYFKEKYSIKHFITDNDCEGR